MVFAPVPRPPPPPYGPRKSDLRKTGKKKKSCIGETTVSNCWVSGLGIESRRKQITKRFVSPFSFFSNRIFHEKLQKVQVEMIAS